MLYHITRVIVYAFVIFYFMLMRIRLSEEITLLEFNEEEEGDQQETHQDTAPGEEK